MAASAAPWEVGDRLLARRACPRPSSAVPRHQQSIWNGMPLDHRRVLIHCHHGLGDTLQFIRYAPLERERASRLIVWAQEPLIPILRSVDGIDELLPGRRGRLRRGPRVMELPFVFRTTPDRVPCDVPYLNPGPPAPCRSPRPAVGIVWAAGDWAPERSMTFRHLEPLLAVDVAWHILQEGRAREQCPGGLGWRPDVSTIVDTARVMRDLDLVITVDSMPAHLAGALGVPVWTLLPADADWRWMSGRADTPWYPTMRLLRQRRAGDWSELTRRAARELRVGTLLERTGT